MRNQTIYTVTIILMLISCESEVKKESKTEEFAEIIIETEKEIKEEITVKSKFWSHIHKTQLSPGGKGKLIIGDNTFINVGTIISAHFQIKIGKNVQIAPGVIMMDSDFHGVEDRDAEVIKTPITIGDNVWLATRVVVLKGVTIGEGSSIATGAVVTKDIPPYSLAAGIPAKVIKKV